MAVGSEARWRPAIAAQRAKAAMLHQRMARAADDGQQPTTKVPRRGAQSREGGRGVLCFLDSCQRPQDRETSVVCVSLSHCLSVALSVCRLRVVCAARRYKPTALWG